MASSPDRRRVLVVDDMAEMRTQISRALTACGYEVDVASTLAAAREMDPGGYDAVLVDAHLGPERGLDLIEALLSENPASAGRYLVMTGGAAGPLPDGVACLIKPFQLSELIDALHALHHPDTVRAPGRQAVITPAASAHAPGVVSPNGDQPAAGEPQSWQLLGLTRRLRAHERRELVDFLHDGPMQELTALTLELEMMARSASPGPTERSDAMLRRLNAATASLRWLIDGAWPFLVHETQLTPSLLQRTAWLLAAPVTVDASQQVNAIEVPVIVDVVELMLLGMTSAGQHGRAHVTVRTLDREIQIELTLTPAAGDDELTGDPVAARAALDALACALGVSAQVTLGEQHWRARIGLPGQLHDPTSGNYAVT